MRKIIKSVAICLMISLSFIAKSQISYDDVVKGLHTFINNDSLKGFNEEQYKQDAMQRGFFGREYNVYMYQSKKAYINSKYNLVTTPPYGSNFKPGTGGGGTINSAPCVNEDFEASPVGAVGTTLAGWVINQGQNSGVNGSCTLVGCCPNLNSNAWIRATPWVDPGPMGVIPNSPLGGTKILQMNDNVWNVGEIVRVQQTFPVTSTNALFQLAYMAAMDGSGHLCCDQPFMKITVLNCTNQTLACPSVSITPPGASCVSSVPSGWFTNTSGISYTTAWQIHSLDLTPYIGSCVTIQITVGDCDGWAHYGYCYIDALCSPMTLQVNNNFFPAGTSAILATGCNTTTAVMTAPPGLGPYLWNGPGGSGITNNPNQTITTTVSGNYTLTMNPVGACAPITKTVTLAFGITPTSGFTKTSVCNNYTFTNTGSGPPAIQTYSFIGIGAPVSYTTTNATSSITFNNPGTYTIQQVMTNTAGCTSTATQVVTIPTGPTLTVNSLSVCPGSAANLNVVGANTYTWSGPGLSANNIPNPVANTSVTAIYTVSGTSGGCTNTTTLSVTALPAPTITVNSTSMCINSSTVVTASGANTYVWFPIAGLSANNIANPTASPLSTTVYTITGTGLNGCSSTQTSTIIINPLPILSVTSSTICPGKTTTLTVTGATTYSWSNGSVAPSITDSPATMTTYTVIGTSLSGCVSSATTSISISPNLTVNISNDGPVCAGSLLNLTTINGMSTWIYAWTGPGFTSNIQNPSIQSSVANSGVYTLSVVDPFGCTGIATTVVNINPNPVVSILSSNANVCAPACVSFTLSSSIPTNNISWFFDNAGVVTTSTTIQCFNKGGVYTSTATVIDNNGCIGGATHTIEIYPTPTADFIFAPLRPIVDNEIAFTDASFGANITNWYWFFNSQTVNSTFQNPNFTYTEVGPYVVTLIVKSDKGCMDTITQLIVVGEDYGIYVPNSFTPNNDGLNDVFSAKGYGITKFEMNIFDRWGERLFTTNDIHNAWDGTYKGVLSKEDAYTWKINLTNVFGKSKELTGHVTLIK